MNLYFQNYIIVLKRNFMLVIIASLLLILTFFIWAGLPVFIIGSVVADLTANLAIIHFCIALSGGFLFSLYFLPINLKVAKNITTIKNRGVGRSFIYLQLTWTLVSSVIFELVLITVMQL